MISDVPLSGRKEWKAEAMADAATGLGKGRGVSYNIILEGLI